MTVGFTARLVETGQGALLMRGWLDRLVEVGHLTTSLCFVR